MTGHSEHSTRSIRRQDQWSRLLCYTYCVLGKIIVKSFFGISLLWGLQDGGCRNGARGAVRAVQRHVYRAHEA